MTTEEINANVFLLGSVIGSKIQIGKEFAQRVAKVCNIPDTTETSQGPKFRYDSQIKPRLFVKPEYIGKIVEVYYHGNSMNVILVTEDNKRIGLMVSMIEARFYGKSWDKKDEIIKSWTTKIME